MPTRQSSTMTSWSSTFQRVTKHLNFFRYHLLAFTFTPLVFSAILYAANGRSQSGSDGMGYQRVAYIDSLFICFSAMTVTGLVTINISALHPFQQALLFILFILGDFSFVALIMVLVRKRFFRIHCETLLSKGMLLRPSRTRTFFRAFSMSGKNATEDDEKSKPRKIRPYGGQKISAPIDARPMGTYADEPVVSSPTTFSALGDGSSIRSDHEQSLRPRPTTIHEEVDPLDSSATVTDNSQPQSASTDRQDRTDTFNPTHAIQILENPLHAQFAHRQNLRARSRGQSWAAGVGEHEKAQRRQSAASAPAHPLGIHLPHPHPVTSLHTGFGGFPGPLQIARHLLPDPVVHKIKHKLSLPNNRHTLVVHPTLAPKVNDPEAVRELEWDEVKAHVAKWMPEKLSGLVIGRNSRFFTEELDDEALEELGGVEYRALRLLSYFVPAYIVLFQLIPFSIAAIYFSQVLSWDSAFEQSSGVQANSVNKSWSILFLFVSAYTGSGMSLVDQNMTPFSKCYLLIFCMILVMLAGNHALPMMLRLLIWIGTKVVRRKETNETLHFLLDHPRRCFLLLFPSHQTWYLVLVLVAFMAIELFGFLVLNLGLPILATLHGFQLFADSLLQSLSVRAAGFGIVSISNMSPSVLFLYVLLMYVAIYPIAMSVRSTNVYEEQALGVYQAENPEDISENEPTFQGKRHQVFGKYLFWHMRRQLAFDVLPLVVAIFLICVVERGNLLDSAKSSWFNVFRIIFECTSAYSTIGMTLGTPNNNYSFAGELSTLSKLILILVMLRGRHRGLPVAIDRAVLLPHEYARLDRRATQDAGTANQEAGPVKNI